MTDCGQKILFLCPMRISSVLLIALLLSAFSLSAQNCDLVVDKTFPNGGFVKTTKQTTMYSLQPNRSLRLYLENLDNETTLGVNWYISPKVLPEGAKLNGKKPLLLTLTLASGKKVTITVLEPMPGSGTYKLKYADYMIGGLASLTDDQKVLLESSPITAISENIYGVELPLMEQLPDTASLFFVDKLPCVAQ